MLLTAERRETAQMSSIPAARALANDGEAEPTNVRA
jgi:hypothetical protein